MSTRLTPLLLAALIAACSDQGPRNTSDPCQFHRFDGSANPSFNSSGILTVSPVDVGQISAITPLGNLNPPEHVYPTDHIYLNLNTVAIGVVSVYAAAPGKVVEVYQPSGAQATGFLPGTDWKVVIEVDKSFYYYYDHILPSSSIGAGAMVTAGQRIGGNAGGSAAGIDLGVYNFNLAPPPGILNECMAKGALGVDSPLKYFTSNVQTELYAKVNVTGAATKDGKFDYDQAGKLVGNWVLAGHKPTESPAYGLAFTYNVYSHALRISTGGAVFGGGSFPGGSYAIQAGAPDWSTITPASGQVNFRLYPTCCADSGAPGQEYGVLAAQMLSPTSIKVEIFPDNFTGTATFTSGAVTYSR